jgi:hypothetical protein
VALWRLGAGTARLAILARELDDDARALRLHQGFKWRIVCRLDRDEPWTLTSDDVRAAVADLEHERQLLEDEDAS